MNHPLKLIQPPKWYEEGLSFKCTGCGKCCSGSPGYVWVDDLEMEKLSKFLKISIDELKKRHLILVGDRYSIRDLKHANYSCVFLKDNQCSVYEARPSQCKTYPFWPNIMKSEKNWKSEAFACEGICDESPKVSLDEIEMKLNSSRSKSLSDQLG